MIVFKPLVCPDGVLSGADTENEENDEKDTNENEFYTFDSYGQVRDGDYEGGDKSPLLVAIIMTVALVALVVILTPIVLMCCVPKCKRSKKMDEEDKDGTTGPPRTISRD